MALTKATLRRELKVNFYAFFDYTLRWISQDTEFLQNDAHMAAVEMWHHYLDWDVATDEQPRGVGKTTTNVNGLTWITWRHPWLQSRFLSATPDVTIEAWQLCDHLWKHHPLLDELRPRRSSEQRKLIDNWHRLTKGRSALFRTLGTKQTGGRQHLAIEDDTEIRETTTTPAQIEKLRGAQSEIENLFFRGHWFNKRVRAGTPWLERTTLDDLEADWVVRIPAYIHKPDGSTTYPYERLSEATLRVIEKRIRNPIIYRRQYGLERISQDASFPIKRAQLRFEDFSLLDGHDRMTICDSAGERRSAEELRNMNAGFRRSDGFCIGTFGVRGNTLLIYDLWSRSAEAEDVLDEIERQQREYETHDVRVESNFSGWPTTIRLRFEARNIPAIVEPIPTTTNKLDRILANLVPLFADGRIVFHKRLADRPFIIDPDQSQFLQLRWHRLPKPEDDAIDLCAIACDQQAEYLYSDGPAAADERIDQDLRSKGAPEIVRQSVRFQRQHRLETLRQGGRIYSRMHAAGEIVPNDAQSYAEGY